MKPQHFQNQTFAESGGTVLARALFGMVIVAALGSAVAGGVLFAFSTFVMAALARLPAAQGIAAMQEINITVINPLFMLAFLGSGAVCLVLIAAHLLGRVHGTLIILASLTYLVGCLGVTMVFNVPLNDSLAVVQASSSEAATVWSHYLAAWVMWNHVRTVAAIATALAFIASLGNFP